jgi:hypothetical protein
VAPKQIEPDGILPRHGLKKKTFDRWMKHLIGVEEVRKHTQNLREERSQQPEKTSKGTHQRRRFGVRTDMRSRAVQAFWAMRPHCFFRRGVCASGATGSTTARSRSTGGLIFIRVLARC